MRLLAMIAFFALGGMFVPSQAQQGRAIGNTGAAYSGYVLHAYEFLDRYPEFLGKTIVLDTWSIPNSFYEDRVLSYSRIPPHAATLGGRIGVQFEKEAKPGLFFYRVMVVNPQGDFMKGTDVQQVGSIAVQMKTAGTYLDPFQDWEVEPLGTIDRTTRDGVVHRIPVVKFWRYHNTGKDAERLITVVVPHQLSGSDGFLKNPETPAPALGPDALRLSIIGIRVGITKPEALKILAGKQFSAMKCEQKGNGFEWCESGNGKISTVRTVFFRDELERITYSFPHDDYARTIQSLRKQYGSPAEVPGQEGLTWGTRATGAELIVGETVDHTLASATLTLHGGLSDRYIKQLAH